MDLPYLPSISNEIIYLGLDSINLLNFSVKSESILYSLPPSTNWIAHGYSIPLILINLSEPIDIKVLFGVFINTFAVYFCNLLVFFSCNYSKCILKPIV